MEIKEANIEDGKEIKNLYLQTFNDSEAELVSEVAVNLLAEKSTIKIISLIVINKDAIVAHIAFSPVFSDSTNKHLGYILAPLAVLPAYQNQKIGSAIVKHGLKVLSLSATSIVFVYGDPQYYCRFGFKTALAKHFIPPYTLKYPEGWQAIQLNSNISIDGSRLRCVDCLDDSRLW